MRVLRDVVCAAFAAVVFASVASASEIGSRNAARSTWDVHETISMLAAQCVSAAPATKPENCDPQPRSILDRVEQSDAKSLAKNLDPTREDFSRYYSLASRWSDDPLRMLESGSSTLMLGLTLLNKCNRANKDGPKWDQRELLCASHFGPLEFLHAQDTLFSDPPINKVPLGKPQDPASLGLSRERMLQWARFAFRAAVDPSFDAMPYCDAIKDPAFKDIEGSLTPSDSFHCNGKHAFTVARFFSSRCRRFSFHCDDLTKHDPGRYYVRQGGTGAILHLIQDSYSQSHAARLPAGMAPVDAGKVFPSLSACQPIATFYDYNAQKTEESETHGNADKPPLIDVSCLQVPRAADDVITASARAIWVLQQAQLPGANLRGLEDELVNDIRGRVLVTR